MTDAPHPAPAAPTHRRGLKIALAVSLALNLAVVGLVAGAWLGQGGPGRGGPRDLSLGPFTAAFNAEDRKALRTAMRAELPALRDSRRAARAEFQALVEALRADPYRPAQVNTALAAIMARNAARLATGEALIADRIAEMDPQARLAFADRLDRAVRRGLRD